MQVQHEFWLSLRRVPTAENGAADAITRPLSSCNRGYYIDHCSSDRCCNRHFFWTIFPFRVPRGLLRCYSVYTIHTCICDPAYHTPLGRLSKLHCSTPMRRVPIPNDTSSESSRRDVSNAELLGTDAIPTAVEISSMEMSPGVWDVQRRIRVHSRRCY